MSTYMHVPVNATMLLPARSSSRLQSVLVAHNPWHQSCSPASSDGMTMQQENRAELPPEHSVIALNDAMRALWLLQWAAGYIPGALCQHEFLRST